MNGRITIELGGVKTPLTFGMLAIEELSNRQAIGSTGWAKLIIDLVYCGYCNEQVLEGKHPLFTYREIAEQVEDLLSVNQDIGGEIYKCFESSKAGSGLVAEVKKKLAEEDGTLEEVKPAGEVKLTKKNK